MGSLVSASDIVISLLLVFVVYVVANNIQQKYVHRFAYYKHFTRAIFIRIFAGVFFSYIYLVFYGDGDTVYYFNGSRSIIKMAGKDFSTFLSLLAGERTPELLSRFDWTTGYPTYFRDANAWAVCRLMAPLYVLGMGSYWGTTIVMNFLLFIPIWNFYRMVCKLYPGMQKQAAIALFYFPSLVFWSSGILKDVWCLAAILQIYVSVWRIFVRRHNIMRNIFIILFWSFVMISIRPFMYYTTILTVLLWVGFRFLRTIDSGVVRTIAFPAVVVFLGIIVFVSVSQLGGVAEGKYATVDSMMEHAVIIQKDLSRDAYGENSFDIGEFDASVGSMLSKAPLAIVAGMVRPFLWEARSILMFFSGIESAFFISLFLYLLFKSGFVNFFRIIYADPFLLSSFVFAVMFGFFVGLTTANFGALVRYKIALLPFFTIVLFRVRYVLQKEEAANE